ncbi:uncharacterized protein LOC134191413 [Corticium candelabrum]|uniref:uncharacterized protein LOC134191413 n=1 Tax=Corticium candelabrum TaxID=121492 RepID=UPI002E2629EA|nr:uncharacterized protein LOC134191413 [Corticium candelabrum]
MRITKTMMRLLLHVLVLAFVAFLATQAEDSRGRNDKNTTQKGSVLPTNPPMRATTDYSNVLKRTMYVLGAVCAIVACIFVVRAVRTSRRHSKRSNGKQSHRIEMVPLALGRDDDDDDTTIYDASKV